MTTSDAINHIHLQTCHSTQEELKTFVEEGKYLAPTLISTFEQFQGRGRRGTKWEHSKGSIAFSFCFKPYIPVTLVPLMIGVHICEFLKENLNIELFLKWPNDLLNQKGEKCGGIICELIKDGLVIIGLGLNMSPGNYAHLNIESDPKKLSREICDWILSRPLNENECRKKWESLCFHMNHPIVIKDEKKEIQGIFTGIGNYGQAKILNQNNPIEAFSGSLFIQ